MLRRLLLLAGVNFLGIAASYAAQHEEGPDSLCGFYTDPQNASDYYTGNNPEDDAAGFPACWYGGLGFGYSYVSPNDQANGFYHDTSENHDTGIQLYIGKRFDAHWFGEFKYADLGKAGITNISPAIAAAYPNAAISYKVPSLMAGYQWRAGKRWQPFVKLGLSSINNSPSGGPVPFEKQSTVQVAFAGGVNYEFGRSPWFMRADIDLYDEDAWFAGIAVGRHFGPKARKQTRIVDSDSDGVEDTRDACPGTAAGRSVDATGCESDADRDGVLDALDACSNTAAGRAVDAQGCELDSDGDAVVDALDACPGTARGSAVDASGCELVQDADKDGVADSKDLCANTQSGTDVDIYGCQKLDEFVLEGVEFERYQVTLKASATPILEQAARMLLQRPAIQVEVAGYTDIRGSAQGNIELSFKRARAVRQFLIERGVDASRLRARGYGAQNPRATNDTVAGRHKNRRVVLRVLQ